MKITKVSKGTSPDRVVVTTDSGEKIRMKFATASDSDKTITIRSR